ncbi:MAG TPA: Ig-like domain-containing protein [Bryobacteraceae bacterium]|nr:Ig-like domain-containing protein [Bryobacteraceae bacterium]
MNSIRNLKLALLTGLMATAAYAQSAYVRISAPAASVLAGAQMQLSATVIDPAGTPLDASGLSWTSSDANSGPISASGVLQGVLPADVTITATDANTDASANILVHIVPKAITIQPAKLQVAAGNTASITAQALDASGNGIAGVQFQYASGEPSVATVAADGTVSGVAEGFATVEARIAGVASNAALVATIPVHVTPKPPYKIRKLFSTETSAPTTITAYTALSAVSAGEVAAIADLANGSQAALLLENGKQTLLAVTGRVLPNAGRMAMRIDGISANANGDVALDIEYPSQWCSHSILFIPHGQPEQELDAGPCFAPLDPRALASDGSVLYRNGDQIWKNDPVNGPRLLFSIATQPPLSDPVSNVNNFYPSRAGTFILSANTASGAQQYFYYDGKALTPVLKSGQAAGGYTIANLNWIAGGSDGKFYATFTTSNGTNYSGLAQLAPGPFQILVKSGDPAGGGSFGWAQTLADAGPAGVLLTDDLNINNSYGTWLALWNGGTLTPLTKVAGWNSMLAGALPASGAPVVSVELSGDTNLPLRSFAPGASPAVLQPAGQPLPVPVPGSIDWHYASHGGSDSAFPVRAAADALLNVGGSVQTIAPAGGTLPNGQLALQIGAVAANESGDLVFSAGFANGNGIFRYHAGGTFDTIADTSVPGKGAPGGMNFNWAGTWRGRYVALNDSGAAAVIGNYNSVNRIVFYGAGAPVQVAQQNTSGPAGVYTAFWNVAVDNNGHVLFIAPTADGHTSAFYWDGNSVKKVIGTGDSGAAGLPVNELSNIAGAGNGFLILTATGNYANRELRYWDGANLTTLQSSDYTIFDGIGLSWYWGNECTLAANGDVHCMVYTQDGGVGISAHRRSGADLVVARSRDQFPGGEWLIEPLSVSSSASGTVYFAAHMYKDGNEFLALYQATPQ